MYRKNDEKIFTVFSILANLAVMASFLLVMVYHFYEGKPLYRDLSIFGVIFSVFCKYQILLLKTYVLEIRVTNLMLGGRKPGKLSMALGNTAILVYSVIFWLTVLGAGIAFFPADWRPAMP